MYIALYIVYYITIVHQMYIIRIYKVQYNVHYSAHCKVQNNYTLNVWESRPPNKENFTSFNSNLVAFFWGGRIRIRALNILR